MTSFLKRLARFTMGAAQPLRFPANGFEIIPRSHKLEEEQFEDFDAGVYYPVDIGEVFQSRYQVVGKLGYGSTSTVWLAQDLLDRDHVALKVLTNDVNNKDEFEMYQHLQTCPTSHPGFRHIRTALDTFTITGSQGMHHCVVQKPLWESFRDLLTRNSSRRFTEELLKAGLHSTLLALDYLHTQCHVVHTDIKADNILQDITDGKILDDFVKAELEKPSPRKTVDGFTIYSSRRLNLPKTFGDPVLSDFGSAVRGDMAHTEDVQPNIYRSPEVMLSAPWGYPIDIWNLGCMIWDIFEDKHLFYGLDHADYNPNGTGYTTRAHLSEVIAVLGPPPIDLLQRGKRSGEFFDASGKWCADIEVPEAVDLAALEENLDGENKILFLNFVRSMLCWRPEDRKTAKQLLDDPWLNSG